MAAGGATAEKIQATGKERSSGGDVPEKTVLPTALRLISSRISSLSGRSDAEQIDAHHTAICFIGLVYISTFWKQFIGMTK
jgi:hypothetical protein